MKVSIVGAGRVGSAAAFSLLHMAEVDELVLIDIIEDLAAGEALDLKHAAYALGKKALTCGGRDYAATACSDVAVIVAGKPRLPGMDRLELASANKGIVESVAKELASHSPKAILIVVTNPLDLMTYFAWRASGLPREKVVGMGGLLDTARLKAVGYEGVVVGEHGSSKVPIANGEMNEIREKMDEENSLVISLKKGTQYAPAACIARQAAAILNDTHEELPCCCVLDGELGLKDVAIGVVAKLGKSGVEQVVEQKMTDIEKERFNSSAESIRKEIRGM